MARHLASDFASLSDGSDGSGGLEPCWLSPWTWPSFQGPSGGPEIGPPVGPGLEVLGSSSCPLPYEFCGGITYGGPQVGLGLMPQVGLETAP